MDPARLALYRSLAPLEILRVDGAEILVAAHPGLAPAGTLSQPSGDPAGFAAVIAAGEAWLRQRGCTRALGPMELCTWFSYRVNLGPWDFPAFPLEPVIEPDLWHRAGYTKVANYNSILVPHASLLERFGGTQAQLEAAGYRFRPLDLDRFEQDLEIGWGLSRAAFAAAYAYVDLPLPAFIALYTGYRAYLDPRLCCLAFEPDGRPVGYYFNFLGPVFEGQPTAIYKTVAVHPRARGMRVAAALLERAHRNSQALGMAGGMVHALMWYEAGSQFLGARGERVVREYGLLAKGLTPVENGCIFGK
jgi:GNAT superfamily N-acetyltransferase